MTSNDHEQLHDWMARAALAGAAATLVELLAARVGGVDGIGLGAAVRLAFVVAAVVPPRRLGDAARLLVLALAAAAVSQLTVRWALPLGALLAGIGLCFGLKGGVTARRRLVVFGAGAAGALAAEVIQRALIETAALSSILGPGLGALAGGAIAGAVMGLGAIGRLLRSEVARSSAPEALVVLAGDVATANAEVGALLRRAADAHRQAIEVISGLPGAEGPVVRKAADDLIRRMVGFGQQWLEVERRTADTTAEQLTERVAVLETRLDKTSDPVARAELGRAIGVVRSQAVALGEILTGRERAVARLEHQVAALERLRLAALRHRSADAGRLQAELQPVVDELTEAGGDYDLASDALQDAERETTVPQNTSEVPSEGTSLVTPDPQRN